MTSRLPGTSPALRADLLNGVWAAAWAAHALGSAPLSLFDANIYHPTPRAFFYGTHALATVPYFGPTFALTGNPTLAANLALLGCLALTAWGLHRVVARWTDSEPAGLVAGSTFLLTPWVSSAWVPMQPSYVPLLYFPWIMLLASVRSPSRGQIVLLSALTALQCLADAVYIAPAVAVPLAVIAAFRILRPERRRDGLALGAALTIALLLQLPLYTGYASVLAAEPQLGTTRAVPVVITPKMAEFGFLEMGGKVRLPTPIPWGKRNDPIGVPLVVLPLLVCGVVCRALGRGDGLRTEWRHAATWVIVGLAISIPVATLFGHGPVRSPLFLLAQRLTPELGGITHAPDRLGVAALMGLSLASGLALTECTRLFGTHRRLAAVVLATLLVVLMWRDWRTGVRWPSPLVTPPRLAPELAAVLREPGGPLLELPFLKNEKRDVPADAEAMFRSIFHWRPLLNGYHSYEPAQHIDRMALASRLPDPAALALLREKTGVELILAHLEKMPNAAQWIASAARPDSGLTVVARAATDILLRVQDPAVAKVAGTPQGRLVDSDGAP